ncbi:MAG: metallophosphoesterase [Gemmatimonadaceae bacterium]|nr:metallophosphoesterase [Gemmatimonadaceae bacterium]
MPSGTLRLLHVSDLHFGRPCIPEVIDAMEAHGASAGYDAVIVSGDVAQRSLSGEFQRAAAFIRDVRRHRPLLIVPGNHDVSWWMSPLHLLGTDGLYTRYRRYISEDLEPAMSVPGARVIGVNTSHGVGWYTLTTRPRDVSIIGVVTDAQLDRVAAECAATPTDTARIVVMHHNPVRGQLSNRFGIKHPGKVIERYARAGVDLVLCGHDHQEAVHHLPEHGGMVVCTAGTLSNRSRGGRPCSFHDITVTDRHIAVTTHYWTDRAAFEPSPVQCFARSSRVPA